MEFGIGARMKAARQLAGFTNVGDLAAAMGGKGLRETTLRTIEQESRRAEARELQEIAEFCGLPLAWFTADFSRLAEISEDPRAVIATETAAAVARSEARRAGRRAAKPPPQAEGHRP